MPRGFDQQMPQSGGSNDFFDLKDGDRAILVLLDEPFLLDYHTLPDASKPFGAMFPCGLKDRYACPVCEDTTAQYGSDAKRLKGKCYYPVYVVAVTKKTGAKEEVNAPKVLSGGARLHDGFMAFYGVQSEFGDSVINVPLVVTRSGSDASTTYSVQKHPKPETIQVPADVEVPDVEKIALRWIDKEWESLSFKPSGMAAPANGATEEEFDPFKGIPAAV